MSFDPGVWRQLDVSSADFEERWRALRESGASLGALDRIRASHGPELARFVSLQIELGRRLDARFPDGRVTFATAKGAEQATSARVADERASAIAARAPNSVVWDACCGIGSDTLALSSAELRVIATDRDPDAAACAAGNLAVVTRRRGGSAMAPSAIVAVGDASRPPLADRTRGLVAVFDPDRRDRSGARIGDPERWAPPLESVARWAREFAGACIKLPPGLGGPAIDRLLEDGARATWISQDGELKELSLWTGSLADGPNREVVRLFGREGRVSLGSDALPSSIEPYGETRVFDDGIDALVGRFLVELDPGLRQSGLDGAVAESEGWARLDAAERGGYFVAERPAHTRPEQSGLARSWRIDDAVAFDRKRVRAMLRAHGIGAVTVKTRGVRESADELAKKLRGPGSGAGLLAISPAGPKSNRVAILLSQGHH